jgi:hypothetical protein
MRKSSAASIAKKTTLVQPKVRTSAARKATVERATGRIGKTSATIDFVRSLRRS